ncbi:MAG: regulator of RNase E activity RraA [Alphaproteobacteria bacterium]|jgi:regulator of RNase E activity RraA
MKFPGLCAKWKTLIKKETKMTTTTLSDETREKFRGISAATLCTALFKVGLRNQFIQNVHPVAPKPVNMVGQAYTMRYIPAREDLNTISVFQDPAHPQRVGVEEIPSGHVMVIDSRKDARAASAGSILITRMMMRGVAGVVTDGGFRDAPEIGQLDMPCYHNRPSAPTNLTLHQAIELNGPIGCGDVAVFPGDVVVGDQEGVVVIPLHMADDIAAEGFEMTAFEDFVTEEVQSGKSVKGLYPPTADDTLDNFAAWRKKNGR